MASPPTAGDFKKAMGSIVLTAGAVLADADRVRGRAGAVSRRKAGQDMRLAAEFCRLLMAPVDECGPGFADVAGFPETYCRRHLSRATDFLRQAVATHDLDSSEARRLVHVAGLVEKSLNRYLGENMAIRCWFGDRLPDANNSQ